MRAVVPSVELAELTQSAISVNSKEHENDMTQISPEEHIATLTNANARLADDLSAAQREANRLMQWLRRIANFAPEDLTGTDALARALIEEAKSALVRQAYPIAGEPWRRADLSDPMRQDLRPDRHEVVDIAHPAPMRDAAGQIRDLRGQVLTLEQKLAILDGASTRSIMNGGDADA